MKGPLSPLNETIYRQTTKDIVRDKIVSLIASGILQVGDDLPSERELSAMLTVSRETVRGAIQRLAGEGVVQTSQGARTRVMKADVDVEHQRIGVSNPKAINGYSLEEVHQARLLVETSVVAAAAVNIQPEDLGRLEDSIVAQSQCLDDPMRFLICDREFHLTIYYASGQKLLADFVVDLYTYMLDHRRIAMGRPGAIARSIEDHRRILLAMWAHDADAVADEMRRHIMHVHDTSIELTHGAPPGATAVHSDGSR